MSFILDALRKLEKEKKEPAPIDLKDRMLQVPEMRAQRNWGLVTAGTAALVLSSAVTWAAINYLKEPAPAPVAVAKKTVTTVSVKPSPKQAGGTKETVAPAKHRATSASVVKEASAMSKQPVRKSVKQIHKQESVKTVSHVPNMPRKGALSQGLGMEYGVSSGEEEEMIDPVAIEPGAEYRDPSFREEDEGYPPAPAIALYPPMQSQNIVSNREETAKFALEGIVFHQDPKHRSAMIRKKGERAGTMVKIGDTFKGLRVAQIEPSGVILLNGSDAVVLSID